MSLRNAGEAANLINIRDGIVAESFPDPGKETDIPVQRVPNKMTTKRYTLKHVTIKMVKNLRIKRES